ncbi:MAG: tetratricopeptide repeat protein [Marinifilaceae bacterium]|nr:tetratricopeptide repeat protein [Marinifilaceae bacterium]
MKYFSLYILLFLSVLSGFGQAKIDSLERILKTSEKKEKAHIYYLLAKEVFYKDVQQLTYYSKKADSIAYRFQIDSIRVNALNFLSYASIHSGKLDDAIGYNKKALKLAKSNTLKKECISSKYFKGYYLYAIGQTDSSLLYLQNAYQEAIIAKYPELKLRCLNTIAANYLNQGKYKNALENFTLAYHIADSLQLKNMLTNLSLNIGTTLLYNEELEKAINYFEKVIAASNPNDVTLAYATAFNNLGACYSRMADHEKALVYFNEALPAYEKLNNKLQIAQVYANLGQSSYLLNKTEEATGYLHNAIKLNRESKSTNQLIVNLILLGQLQTMKQEYLQAKCSLEEAEDLIKSHNINYNKSDLYKIYSYYFSQTNQLKKALDYKQKELNLRDSTFNRTRQQQISELQTKFETKLKENENENLRKDLALTQLNTEKQNQIQNFLIIVAFLVIILVVILLNRARLKKISHEIIEKQKLELEIANSTKDKFFSIIAHDLRSPFSALVGLCELLSELYDELSDDDRKIYIHDLHEASKNTFNLLENLLTWSRIQQGNIKIEKKVLNISNLIQNSILPHQATAKLKKISISNLVPTQSNVLIDKNSIETVIMNLINNALKFTNEGGTINISSKEKGNKLIISIADSGVGMTKQQIDKLFKIDENKSTSGTSKETGTGLGLILCKEFIELNNEEIWVESEQGKGSIFSFSIERS